MGTRIFTILLVITCAACPGTDRSCKIGGTSCLGFPCEAGYLVCGGETVCSDIQNDRLNCGGCGVVCGAGEYCSGGTCTPCNITCQGTQEPNLDTCTCECASPGFVACGATECCSGSCCDGICCPQGTM